MIIINNDDDDDEEVGAVISRDGGDGGIGEFQEWAMEDSCFLAICR